MVALDCRRVRQGRYQITHRSGSGSVAKPVSTEHSISNFHDSLLAVHGRRRSPSPTHEVAIGTRDSHLARETRRGPGSPGRPLAFAEWLFEPIRSDGPPREGNWLLGRDFRTYEAEAIGEYLCIRAQGPYRRTCTEVHTTTGGRVVGGDHTILSPPSHRLERGARGARFPAEIMATHPPASRARSSVPTHIARYYLYWLGGARVDRTGHKGPAGDHAVDRILRLRGRAFARSRRSETTPLVGRGGKRRRRGLPGRLPRLVRPMQRLPLLLISPDRSTRESGRCLPARMAPRPPCGHSFLPRLLGSSSDEAAMPFAQKQRRRAWPVPEVLPAPLAVLGGRGRVGLRFGRAQGYILNPSAHIVGRPGRPRTLACDYERSSPPALRRLRPVLAGSSCVVPTSRPGRSTGRDGHDRVPRPATLFAAKAAGQPSRMRPGDPRFWARMPWSHRRARHRHRDRRPPQQHRLLLSIGTRKCLLTPGTTLSPCGATVCRIAKPPRGGGAAPRLAGEHHRVALPS